MNTPQPTSDYFGKRYTDFMFVGYVTVLHVVAVALAMKGEWIAMHCTVLTDLAFAVGAVTKFYPSNSTDKQRQ